MSAKQYPMPDMPEEESHAGFNGLLEKLRTLAGVHDVRVDRTNKHVTVHVNDDEFLPNVDQVILEFGQLPGFTGQV